MGERWGRLVFLFSLPFLHEASNRSTISPHYKEDVLKKNDREKKKGRRGERTRFLNVDENGGEGKLKKKKKVDWEGGSGEKAAQMRQEAELRRGFDSPQKKKCSPKLESYQTL